jgi:hypothetical protein
VQRLGRLDDGAGGVDDVVLQDADAALDVADDVHHLGRARLRAAPLVDDGEVGPEPLGVGPGALGAAGVRRHDRHLAELLPRQVVDDDRGREQVVGRDVEERLDLRLVQVHRQHPIGAGGNHEVGDQLGRDRDARLVLAVLPGVAVIRDDGRDARRGRAAERVHHDAELHQVLVDRPGGGLDDEHVHAADVLVDLERDLRVGEAMEPGLAHRHAQELGNLLRQQRVGAAGEEPEFRLCHAVRHPGDLFRCACSDVHDGGPSRS